LITLLSLLIITTLADDIAADISPPMPPLFIFDITPFSPCHFSFRFRCERFFIMRHAQTRGVTKAQYNTAAFSPLYSVVGHIFFCFARCYAI